MLHTNVGAVQLATPLLLASGFITETPDFFLRARSEGCAGIVTRSLKMHVPPERAHVPVPRYAIFERESMLNCEWGNERPWTEWRDRGVASVKDVGAPIILSLSGRDPEGCADLMREFDQLGQVDAYEVNVSCSHSGALHGNLNVDMEHLTSLMRIIRPATRTPIWVKLSYSTFLLAMAAAAERLGADAIVCTNSIGPGMLIDVRTGRPEVGIQGGGGGLTGKAIFPIALWCVHQLAQTVSIPVIGCGGISTANHVIQMLMAGAVAVQLYTAPALGGPRVFKRITNGLRRFLRERTEYVSLLDVRGCTAPYTSRHTFSSPVPIVLEKKCTGCGLCIDACAFDSLSLIERQGDRPLAVIASSCISCNACVGVCPPKFGAIIPSFGSSA